MHLDKTMVSISSNLPSQTNKKWSKLRASTVKPSIPARAPMTPVNRRGKMDLVVNCPSSTQSCPAVREWSKLKHDSQFVNETKLQHEEARKIRETFASPTKVAAWKIREQTKKGTSGGGRCASDISADLPSAFLSSMDRRGSAPTYAVNKESKANRNQAPPDSRRSTLHDFWKSLDLDDHDAKLEARKGGKGIVVE